MLSSCRLIAAKSARNIGLLAPAESSLLRYTHVSRLRGLHLKRSYSQRFVSFAAALNPAPTLASQSSTLENATKRDIDIPVCSVDERKVVIGWDPQNWSRFHHIWLRDHCRCPQCFHPVTKQRLVDTFEIPREIMPVKAESKPEGLEVIWPSSHPHTSFYPWSWLREHSYDPRQKSLPVHDKILWGSKIQQDPPTVTYEEAMNEQDDKGLFKWLSKIDRFGFCFITGVPPTTEDTQRLSERIGFIRETHYGGFWDFTSDLAKGDTAYTTLALGAHTDNTYFTDPCGLQLFHLLSHTSGSGGATLLVDGFYVASILKELHPKFYSLLSEILVPAHAAGEPSAIYRPSPASGYPVLSHDALTGDLHQVRWNNDDRSVMDHLSPDIVEEWYDAVRMWNTLLRSSDSEFWIQLSAGTAVVVDNHRVLHGRSAFTGLRRMCGAYIGVDEYKSKLAVLAEKYAPDPVSQETMRDEAPNERSVWNSAL